MLAVGVVRDERRARSATEVDPAGSRKMSAVEGVRHAKVEVVDGGLGEPGVVPRRAEVVRNEHALPDGPEPQTSGVEVEGERVESGRRHVERLAAPVLPAVAARPQIRAVARRGHALRVGRVEGDGVDGALAGVGRPRRAVVGGEEDAVTGGPR